MDLVAGSALPIAASAAMVAISRSRRQDRGAIDVAKGKFQQVGGGNPGRCQPARRSPPARPPNRGQWRLPFKSCFLSLSVPFREARIGSDLGVQNGSVACNPEYARVRPDRGGRAGSLRALGRSRVPGRADARRPSISRIGIPKRLHMADECDQIRALSSSRWPASSRGARHQTDPLVMWRVGALAARKKPDGDPHASPDISNYQATGFRVRRRRTDSERAAGQRLCSVAATLADCGKRPANTRIGGGDQPASIASSAACGWPDMSQNRRQQRMIAQRAVVTPDHVDIVDIERGMAR